MTLPAVLDHLPLTQGGKPVVCSTTNCCTPGVNNCWGGCDGLVLPSTLYADLPAVINTGTNSFSTAGGVFACTRFDQTYIDTSFNIPHVNLPTNNTVNYPGVEIRFAAPNCFYLSGVIGSECGIPVRAIIVLWGIDIVRSTGPFFYAGYVRVSIQSIETSPGIFEDRYDITELLGSIDVPLVTFPDYPFNEHIVGYDNEALNVGATVGEAPNAVLFADCFNWAIQWEWYGQSYWFGEFGGTTRYCIDGPIEDYTVTVPAKTIRVSTS